MKDLHCLLGLVSTYFIRNGFIQRIARSHAELIFVADITDYIRGEKLSCGEILEKFLETLEI